MDYIFDEILKNELPNDFDYETYIKLNPDLNILSEYNAKTHYLLYGKKENRIYKIVVPDDFNYQTYIELNVDLKINSEDEAIMHYLTYGRLENRSYNRKVPDDFNYLIYIDFNPDLNIKTEIEAIEHFLLYGRMERRLYKKNLPDDFIYSTYLELNLDLASLSIDELENHYILYGKNEDRFYKKIIFDETKDDNLFFKFLKDSSNNILSRYLDNYKKIETNNKSNLNYYEIIKHQNIKLSKNIDDINNINSFILIIDFPFIKTGGGTEFFINCIIAKYKYHQTFLICRNINDIIKFYINDEYILINNYNEDNAIQFLKKNNYKIIKIFINHTYYHKESFINQLKILNKEITTITHDYLWISDRPQMYYHELVDKYYNNIRSIYNIDIVDRVITQDDKNLDIFTKYINPDKIIVLELPDFKKSDKKIMIDNRYIVIGVIGYIHEWKGKYLLEYLINFYRNTNVKFVIFGTCLTDNKVEQNTYSNIFEFNELLIRYKPNILLDVSLWPETYCYSLSLAMITQLPIISINKNYDSVVKNRLLGYDKSYFFNTIYEFNTLINEVKQDYLYTIEPTVFYNDFWDEYFIIDKKQQEIYNISNLNIFAIYFPQFHIIQENNISFYENYTDYENLKLLINSDIKGDFEQPIYDNYNLTDNNIIQKQIDIITDYNIKGFAIYYYWFSLNTITNKNLIMKEVIDKFFDNQINLKKRKIFFIWANEDWSGNPAFGSTNNRIENIYNEGNILLNANNLLQYFKHDNYLKIDNKPVLMLYHSWYMKDDEINLFYLIINDICIKNRFNGFQFYLNSMEKEYNGYKNFNINFNYKNSLYYFHDHNINQRSLDYENYINNNNNNSNIQTIVFDFDNRVRLFKPNRLDRSTICINNTEFNKKRFIDKIYKQSDNILLLNAWNEWGEKMIFEPSKEYGFYNLNLLINHININTFDRYPSLFNKYKYKFSNISEEIYIYQYNYVELKNRIIIHIHCYDLNLFEKYFIEYIKKFDNIIITFCVIDECIIRKYNNIIFLNIKNKGYDIGGKIACITFLKDYNYDYILFIHSKSDNENREKYINPFLKFNMNNLNNNIYGVFPNLLIDKDSFFIGTEEYRKEILDYLKCSNKDNIFIEGNCMILHRDVIDFVFSSREKVFYNLLNDFNSFDINWINKKYFNGQKLSNQEVYNLVINNNIYTNDFQHIYYNKNGLRDCMIEHVFERIWLNCIKHLKKNYIIL